MNVIPLNHNFQASDPTSQAHSSLSSQADAVDTIVIGIGTDQKLGKNAQEIDQRSDGLVRRLLEAKELTGKLLDRVVVPSPHGLKGAQLVVVGTGSGPLSPGDAFRTCGVAAQGFANKARDRVLYALDNVWNDEVAEAAVAGGVAGVRGQDLFRAEKKRFAPNTMLWADLSAANCERGQILGNAINRTRRLVDLPPRDLYPETFAQEAVEVASQTGMEIEIWDENRLAAERCESLLAVGRGSARPPRLVILRYRGASDPQAPLLGLVGKGVTFDSGGLSIKPTDGMKTMKCDMAGAATVLGAMEAIARFKLPVNVLGIAGLVENLLGPHCMKLGDVLKARNGRTIEVLNTDAEGRLVLADALAVAVDAGATKLIDLATLTGACLVALGSDVAGIMTNNTPWCDIVKEAARDCGEWVWELPMFDEYSQLIRSDVADIKNVGDGRNAGAITAAKFLQEFVAGVPWVHCDIAGPAYQEKPKAWSDAGGSGALVRTLVEVAKRFPQVA